MKINIKLFHGTSTLFKDSIIKNWIHYIDTTSFTSSISGI